MRITIHFILIYTLLTIGVQSQGGGGGSGSRGGGSSSGSYKSNNKPCSTFECEMAIIALKVASVLIAVGIIIWSIKKWIVQCTGGRPPEENTEFINQNSRNNLNFGDNPFVDGVWSSRYYQYDKWHTSHQLLLSFNRYSYKVSGQGRDDIGSYTIDGIFCMRTLRMGLTKVYKAGTGDPIENLGHTVTIQLTWDSQHNRFRGKWYTQTNKYRGEGQFELNFEEASAPLLETNNCDWQPGLSVEQYLFKPAGKLILPPK
ncbi:unnamed protein product, partial [Rotaria sp. Silwood1]